jgi:transcriptional regulator with XRE-family HTH domain
VFRASLGEGTRCREAQTLDVIALWTGHRASRFRLAYRMTVEGFAEKLGVGVRTVANWEARPDMVPTLTLQEALDTALQGAPPPVRARLALLLADGSGDETAVDGADSDMGAMQAFRMADLRVGGGHLYPAVAEYLRGQVSPRLVAVDEAGGRGVFTAAAAITEMAGWMAHDAGRDERARRHFARALDLVAVARDARVKAHILGSMSHLEERLRNPDEAIRLARAGRDALVGTACNPGLNARLCAIEARAQAALRNPGECIALLTRAEHSLGGPAEEAPSTWVAGFDEGALASEAARCMQLLGDLDEARRQAERVIQLRPASRARSRAFGRLMLAGTLAAQGEHEGACAVAGEVVDATQTLSSHVVVQQLRDLASVLAPHRSSAVIGDFLARLEVDLQHRAWLFERLAADDDLAIRGVPA